MTFSVGVDIGGTFVDAVAFDHDLGELNVAKASTTPDRPTQGVYDSIDKLGVSLSDARTFVHGTTLGLNAVLERTGANAGILTNEGFTDVFEMGRYARPDDRIYSLEYDEPEVLVPGRQRVGVPGRMDADGEIVEPLDEDAVRDAVAELVEERSVDSIAVCFLHSYTNPEHETRAAEIISSNYPNLPVSISSDITRQYREYERTSTAVMNAYIKPLVESYLDDLDETLVEEGFDGAFFVTRSGGGALRAIDAREAPVHTILSGPAGGLIGAARLGTVSGRDDLIAVDMGGTSTDACVVRDGSPTVKFEAELERLPLMVPIYDIRTIGAGGGSIAWVDGELLKVGPRSAGADPGPICYGRGGEDPTVTDAALVLGYLDPGAFLGGQMSLAVEEARSGIRRAVADQLGSSPVEASRGILAVTVGKTVGAIREITVETGLDPRDLPLVAYGGAGPMMMPLVAREMGLREVVIPRSPAVFSAWGMLMTDIVQDFSVTEVALLEDTTIGTIESHLADLVEEADEALSQAGFGPDDRHCERYAELRYFGQEHTLEVSMDDIDHIDDIRERFARRHERRYGHTMDHPVQVVHYRVRGIGTTHTPSIGAWEADGREFDETREAYCFASDDFLSFDVYRRDGVGAGATIDGPAIIREPTTTIVIQSDQRASVDEFGHLIVRTEEGSR